MPNFHYLPTLSRAQDELDRPSRLRAGPCRQNCGRARRASRPAAARSRRSIPQLRPPNCSFDIYAYICGLNNMVSGVRDKLAGYGWHKKQIVFERYD